MVASKQALDAVTSWFETDVGIGQVRALLETSDGFPGTNPHVHHVQIEYAHLHVATRAKDAFAFRDNTVLDMFRAGSREPQDCCCEKAHRERESVCKVWMVDCMVVCWRLRGSWMRRWSCIRTNTKVVHIGIGVCQRAVERPVIIAQSIYNEDTLLLASVDVVVGRTEQHPSKRQPTTCHQ